MAITKEIEEDEKEEEDKEEDKEFERCFLKYIRVCYPCGCGISNLVVRKR